jgi:hypothetical protein
MTATESMTFAKGDAGELCPSSANYIASFCGERAAMMEWLAETGIEAW